MPKRWSYAEITKATEAMIRFHMEDHDHPDIHKSFAQGARLLWFRLTMGWQKDGDDERLNRLIEIKEDRNG